MARIGIKNKRDARNFLLGTFAIIIIFTGIGFSGLLNKLDLRFYDLLFRFKKEIPQNEKVVIVKIDDDSINEFGEWPWTRDIIADGLIRMKELGAESISFDIEYLSPSAKGVSSNAREIINENISSNLDNMVSLIDSLSKAPQQGYNVSELPGLADELVEYILKPSFTDLQDNIVNNIYADYDDYFSRAIQFFGNVYLTINMRDLGIPVSEDYSNYLKKRILINNVNDINNLILKGNLYEQKRLEINDVPGFSPTMEQFMKSAKSASFTNSVVDDDGIRRRMELLAYEKGSYVPQLSLGPLLDNLKVTEISRNRRSLILHNAQFPGEENPIDLKIPLDPKGYFVINWRHGLIDQSFRNESFVNLKLLDITEDNIFSLLKAISSLELISTEGEPLGICSFAQELVEFYNQILDDKNYLLSLCTGFDANNVPYDGITDENYEGYFAERKDFFDNVKAFTESGLENEAFELLDFLIENYPEAAENFEEYKEALNNDIKDLKAQYASYIDRESTIRKNYEGAYLIIGNTAVATTDIGAVPFIKQYANVGIHGNIMNTILEKKFIYYYEWFWIFIFSIIVSLLPLFIQSEKKSPHNIAGAVICVVFISLYITLFIVFNIYFPMITSIIYLLVNYLYGIIFRFVNSDREKKFITNAFSQCLSKDVVEDIIKDPSSLKLGGDSRNMTAMFTDIQKFSTFSELLNAAELVALLNYYLTKMSDIIMEERGTVDKYEGDAIIALVGAPLELPDHAFRACSAAIKMKKAEALMNQEILKISQEDMPSDMDPNLYSALKIMVSNKKTIFTRIGINSGEMVAGFMGSENKKNYTMMGNNVNLASRLEGVNKAYASSILISEQTWDWANVGSNRDKITVRRLDKVRVVGINKPVQLYNLIGFSNEISNDQKKEIDMFHTALDMYLEKNFVEAGKLFLKADSVFHDDTALIFAERCKNYIENGIPENWDGVLNMTTK